MAGIRPGSGGQITRIDLPAWLDLTRDQVAYRLRSGAIPVHDGRTDWVPWWWISSLDQIGLPESPAPIQGGA